MEIIHVGQTLPHRFVHKIQKGEKLLDIFEWVEKKNAEKCLGSTKFETCSMPCFCIKQKQQVWKTPHGKTLNSPAISKKYNQAVKPNQQKREQQMWRSDVQLVRILFDGISHVPSLCGQGTNCYRMKHVQPMSTSHVQLSLANVIVPFPKRRRLWSFWDPKGMSTIFYSEQTPSQKVKTWHGKPGSKATSKKRKQHLQTTIIRYAERKNIQSRSCPIILNHPKSMYTYIYSIHIYLYL